MFALLFFVASGARGATNIIDRADLPSRTHCTWEGPYRFSGELVVKIHEMKDLHVLTYRKSGSEGVLVDFAEVNDKGDIRILLETNANPKGVVPAFEGVDVFPGSNEAEIIVRWRHPGNGGFRTVEKYRYTAVELVLMTRSEFMDIDGEKIWISTDVLERKDAEMKEYPAVRKAILKTEKKQ
jgi:hypothetical protein